MADVYEQFRAAERLETLAGVLYRLIAARLPAGSKAAAVFTQLAAEEDQHALRIRMLRQQYQARPKAFQEPLLDLAEVNRLITEAEALQLCFANSETCSLEDARRFMVEQEKRFAVAHAQVLAATQDAAAAAFFRELARMDQMHARQLESIDLGAPQTSKR